MTTKKTRLLQAAFGALATVVAFAAAPARAGTSSAQATIDHAVGTLQDLQRDKEFGTAKQLMRRARAVMIAPRIFKAGFFFGGEGGEAVLSVHNPGGWTSPAFFTVASASFGLQIGAQESEMIIFIMSDKALKAVLRDKFKVGANADIAVVTLGSSAEAATTANGGADIYVWASASGAYAGLTLNGTLIQADQDDNYNYYGHAMTPAAIIARRGHNAGAASLTHALGGLG